MRAVFLLAALKCAFAFKEMCDVPQSLEQLKPIIDAFSGSATLTIGSNTLTGTAYGTAMAFSGTSIGTHAYLVECLVSLALDYGSNKGWVQLYAPTPAAGGLKQPRCLLAEAQSGQGNAQLSVTSDLNATSCAVKRRTLNGTSANLISVTGFSTATADTTTFDSRCAAIYSVGGVLAPFAFEGAYTHPGSGNAVKVLVSSTSVLMHVRSTSLTPAQDSYAKASCVRAATVLNAGSGGAKDEARLTNGDGNCMYIKMNPAASVLQVTDFIPNCDISSFAAAKVAASSTRVSGRFLALPAAAGPAAAAPPPPATAMAVQVVPVATFTQAFTMPADTGSDDLAIKLMNPCAVASIRSAYAASLGVPMASVILSTLTFADGTPGVSLSPTEAGNLASGLCASSRRLAVAAGAAARALPGATSTVTASTTIANPPAAASLAVPAGFTINVVGVGSSSSSGASSAPVFATQALPQPVPLITRLTPYVPSELIKSAHAQPRGKDSTNDFSLTGLSDMSGMMKCAQSLGAKDSCPNTYIFGAIAPGVGLIAAGIVFLIVWFFAYGIACCTSCCRTKCCPKRDRSAGGKFERCAKVLPIVRAVLGVITCGLVLGGLGSVQKFPGGLTAVTDLVNSFSNTLASLALLLAPSSSNAPVPLSLLDGTVLNLVSPSFAVAAAASNFTNVNNQVNTGIYLACSGAPSGQCTQPTIATLISALTSALNGGATSIGAASNGITGVQSTVTNSLGSISLKGLETQITMYASAALGVIAAIILFQAVLVCRTFFACCVFKSLAPISIILNFIIFLLSGIFYILGNLGADLCIAPNELLLKAINEPNLNFFLTCATDPKVPPAPALGLVSTVVNLVQGGLSQIASLGEQVDANLSPPGSPAGYGPLIIASGSTFVKNPAFAAASTNLNSAVTSIMAIPNQLLSCQQVDAMFSRLWDGLCNGTVTSAIGISRVLVAAGVFMLIQLALSIDHCCYHPGDKNAWADGGHKVASSDAPAAAHVPHHGDAATHEEKQADSAPKESV